MPWRTEFGHGGTPSLYRQAGVPTKGEFKHGNGQYPRSQQNGRHARMHLTLFATENSGSP